MWIDYWVDRLLLIDVWVDRLLCGWFIGWIDDSVNRSLNVKFIELCVYLIV